MNIWLTDVLAASSTVPVLAFGAAAADLGGGSR